jgi:hypothetical protein
MIAIIGAIARLAGTGITWDDATDTVLRILLEEATDGCAPGRSCAMGFSPRKASAPPIDAP